MKALTFSPLSKHNTLQSSHHNRNSQLTLEALELLKADFSGEIFSEYNQRLLYATDASAYREVPLAVARPRDKNDILKLLAFAKAHNTSLIPRTAGTSLAGQVVGSGIIVDVSRYMTRILELNEKERWVKVEPGVILDELNTLLKPTGLFFGPETSTSNRCMIGGMVGNNSCGAHSLVYGSTRDHTLEIEAILSDGSQAVFGSLTKEAFQDKCLQDDLEGKLYRQIDSILCDPENQKSIREEYPDPRIHRRNTGYALDLLLESDPFTKGAPIFNMCKLLAGSEGTLAFTTAIKLNLVPLPPPVKALVCVHCHKIEDAFLANLIALKHKPVAVELMDRLVLEQTRNNISQRKNRFFVEGDPAAILIVEFAEESIEAIEIKAHLLEKDISSAGMGYHFPRVLGNDIKKVWNLRKAGLGVLSNIPGDAKPVAVIEDTAVAPDRLPDYMEDFQRMLQKYNLQCVYYAHIATGELHLRPVLNLKDPKDVDLFYQLALETATLVKKYKGSLSGEHGDGRLRGQFIPLMLGERVYQLIKEIKHNWDPYGIFNPGKITDTPKMNTSLRYEAGHSEREIKTIFDFSNTGGILRAAEQCNGSGDCRKTELSGGTMCPSYMATREEHTTTRARANILREFLTHSPKQNPFDHKEIFDIMDLCLSCKACKSECPSNVDIAKYKAEFLQHYYDSNGISLRTRAIANIGLLNQWASLWPNTYNYFINNRVTSSLIKKTLGFASERSIPKLAKKSFSKWMKEHLKAGRPASVFPNGTVYIFADEFTNYTDALIGSKAVLLLNALGYFVDQAKHDQSGRTYLSKGLVRKAAALANTNVRSLQNIITENSPLIGIEPSAILTFRDEYPDLVSDDLKEAAISLGNNALMFEEFIVGEFRKGKILQNAFHINSQSIRLHGHCHQKALSSTGVSAEMLSIPENYKVEEIPSGCCGMAGSFGFEAEHYETSMKVGELVLFPEIRKTADDIILAAPGTSCRHQIADGTGRKAYHPIEILFDALV